jgi:hypothetical protein
MKTITALLSIFCLALAVTPTAARAGNNKVSPDLQSRTSAAGIEVIVQYKVKPTEAHYQRIRNLGGTVHGKMNHVKAGHYTIPASALESLSEDPDVAYISPNRPLKGSLNITAATVHSDIANTQGYTGTGIGVAVIDSGMADMAEFHNGPSRVVYQQSFVQTTPALNMSCPEGGAQAGAWYGSSMNVQGGVAPYAVSIAGSLPAGLTLDTAGNITGIPAAASTGAPANFTATVLDAWGNSNTQSCKLNVGPAPKAPPQLHLGCAAAGAQAGVWYDSVLSPQGGVAPYQFSVSSGTLPAGLTLNASTGVITGWPRRPPRVRTPLP